MYRRAELLRPTLAACAGLALLGLAALVQYRQWGDASYSVVAAALAGGGMALALMGAVFWRRMQRMRQMATLADTKVTSRTPFWIAVAAPFERPPRR